MRLPGVDHHRQKRVIDPGFGPVQLRQFYTVFRRKAAKVGHHARRGPKMTPGTNRITQLSTRLHEVVRKSDDRIINVAPWLAHTTLDIIGESENPISPNLVDNAEVSIASCVKLPFQYSR